MFFLFSGFVGQPYNVNALQLIFLGEFPSVKSIGQVTLDWLKLVDDLSKVVVDVLAKLDIFDPPVKHTWFEVTGWTLVPQV